MAETGNEISKTVNEGVNLNKAPSIQGNVNVRIITGDPLDPHQILRSGGTHSEKQQKVVEFKDRLLENKEAVVDVIDDLTKNISANPDMSREELMGLIASADSFSKLTPYQIEALQVGLKGYEVKHKFVHKIRTDYPDDAELFEAAFRRKPKGRVEIVEGPISLYFRCYDPEDYSALYWGIFSGGTNPNEFQVGKARQSGGVFLSEARPAIPGLIGSVIVENAHGSDYSSINRRTMVHEEQHAIWHFLKHIGKTTYGLRREDMPSSVRNEQEVLSRFSAQRVPWSEQELRNLAVKLQDMSDSQKGQYIGELLRSIRKWAEERAGDEFLAYFKSGMSPAGVLETLTPTEDEDLYDYFPQEWRDKVTERWIEVLDEELRPLVSRQMDKVFIGEYRGMLKNGAKALTLLKNIGYSERKIIAFLMTEPFSNWEKTARRLLESRGIEPSQIELYAIDIPFLYQEDINDNSPLLKLRYNENKTAREMRELQDLEERYDKRKKLTTFLYETGRLKNNFDYFQAATIMFHYGNSMDEYKLGEECIRKAQELAIDEKTRGFYKEKLERWRKTFIENERWDEKTA